MEDSDENTRTRAGKTVAYGGVDDLLLPDMEAGKAYLIVIKGRSVGRMLELRVDRPAVIGRATDAELPIEDQAISRRHARVEPDGDGFSIVDLDSTNGLFVNNARVRHQELHDGDRIQLGATTIMKFCYQDAVEESFQKKLYESATRDALTGTYNRQYLLDSLEAEFSYCARNKLPLSLLMLDIDHFKTVNDRFGHLAGDYALRQVAELIQKDLRAEDILARYGGEEFAVMLRHANAERARSIAERIRLHMLDHAIEFENHRFGLTVSIGVGTLSEGDAHATPHELVRTADTLLYRAKQSGRNCTIAGLEGEEPLEPTDTTARLEASALQAAAAARARKAKAPARPRASAAKKAAGRPKAGRLKK